MSSEACEPHQILCKILCKSKYTLLWEGFRFPRYNICVYMIQNRLKTIVHAPVSCAYVIPGVGILQKHKNSIMLR